MNRRDFLAFAAAAPAAGAMAARLDKVPSRRAGKVEIVFDSPGHQPNGLQATREGLWIIDQGPESMAALVRYQDGKVVRSFTTETDRSSGITCDGETLWIGSTYSREIVRTDAKTGKTVSKHFTPGAGVIYKMLGDPPARSSPLVKSRPRPAGDRAAQKKGQSVGGFQQGQVLGAQALGTGAHGQEWRNGKLWFAVPPSREIYRMDPESWVVETKFPTAANRPHGIGWEGKYLWATDSNLNAFFKHDPDTGEMVEKIQLADTDPLPHGMTIWDGMLWYCDDVGVVCRMKL
jgi:streptogramin lyase